MNNCALPHGLDCTVPSWRPSTPGKAKNFIVKIARNPLKSLNSDEKIQENPSLKKGDSKPKGLRYKKTQT